MITLSDGTSTLELSPDLTWSDENNWFPVEQTAQRTITGALVISASTRIAGRPITLEPEDDSSAWMPHTSVATLRNWAAVPGKELTLTLRGVARQVVFRHHDGTGLEASPVKTYRDVQDTDFYTCVLRLMEID